MKWDFRDWVIAGHVGAAWIAATVYIFLHADDVNFVTWAGFSTTVGGIYHWLVIRDSKEKDACSPS